MSTPAQQFTHEPARGRKRLAVVIINYKTPGLVADCLATLEPELDHARDTAIIVDNHSSDGSPDEIQRTIDASEWNGWARLVRSDVNGGFSAGNNIGIKAVPADFYLLLNSDTLVRSGAIAELLHAAEANPKAGLVGPRLEWPDGSPQNSCFRDKTIWSELIAGAQSGPVSRLLAGHDVTMGVFDRPMSPQWLSFACVMLPAKVVEHVGLMDEGYFMYFEDADYGHAVRRAGYDVLHWPAARVVHIQGGTAPVKSQAAARKRLPAYYYAARSRYFVKRGGRPLLIAANAAWSLGWLIALARRIVQGRRIGTPQRALRDNWTAFTAPMRTWRPGGVP